MNLQNLISQLHPIIEPVQTTMELTKETTDLLKKIYETPSHEASFTAAHQLRRVLKNKYKKDVPLDAIKEWLSAQRSYTLHKSVRHNFPDNPIIACYLDEQWEADLMFLPDLTQFNDGFKIALVCVDVVSRKAFVEPMKTKHGEATVKAFMNILKRSHPRKPEKLHTDAGKEFLNSNFQKLMKDEGIIHFITKTDRSKAAIAERFNRTLKEKIYKFLDSNPSNHRYLEVLQDLVDSYNNTFHSAIKMTPNEVNRENESQALWNLYHKYWTDEKDPPESGQKKRRRKYPSYDGQRDFSRVRQENLKRLLQVDDLVRLAGKKYPHAKGYKGNWTEELFKVSKVHRRHPYFVYEVTEIDGEPIDGVFYVDELQKVQKPKEDEFWQVEKVLKTRKRKGHETEYLVKWFGYSPKFNSWVPESNMISTI